MDVSFDGINARFVTQLDLELDRNVLLVYQEAVKLDHRVTFQVR
jgi:hypothetical protein